MKKPKSDKEKANLADWFDFSEPFYAKDFTMNISNSLFEKSSNFGCLDFLTQNIPYLKAILIVDSSFEILKVKTIDSKRESFTANYQSLIDYFKVQKICKLPDSKIFMFENDLIFSYKLGQNSIIIVMSDKISTEFFHYSFFSN